MLKLIIPVVFAAQSLTAHSSPTALPETSCSDKIVNINIGDNPSSSRTQIFTDLTFYMLNGLSPDKSCSITGVLTVRCGQLYSGACQLLSAATTQLDYEELRDFYQQHHLSTIHVRKHDDYIKNTLSAFTTATSYQNWPRQVVNRSNIKQKTRVIYRSPANFPQQISVSETRDCDDGNLNAERLETEIAIRRHGPGRTFEFYTYDKNGNLAEHSEFPAGDRPSPTICVSCHYHPGQRAVSRFIPN
jgi:hypothetical protein